jgi:hypothetical protein
MNFVEYLVNNIDLLIWCLFSFVFGCYRMYILFNQTLFYQRILEVTVVFLGFSSSFVLIIIYFNLINPIIFLIIISFISLIGLIGGVAYSYYKGPFEDRFEWRLRWLKASILFGFLCLFILAIQVIKKFFM